MFEVFWSPLPDFVADPHTLSGFFHFKEVSHDTEHYGSKSTQGKSGRNIQHEDGQHHLCYRRSFQQREQGHLGGEDEAIDAWWCENGQFLNWKLFVTFPFSILTKSTRKAALSTSAEKCFCISTTGWRFWTPSTSKNPWNTIPLPICGAKRIFWS